MVGGATSGDDEDAAAESVLAQVSIDRFRRPTQVPNVDLMPAGYLDATYQSRLANVNWQLLYDRTPGIFRSFARRMARDYDVVLVGSRTGMTDISGICTALLPDKLVVVFTANQQSLTGIERLVRSSVEYRQGSRDVRPLLVYPLPSRIDAERDELRLVWRHGNLERRVEGFQPQFERIFRAVYGMESCDLSNYCNEVQVQHQPRLLVWRGGRGAACARYRSILDRAQLRGARPMAERFGCSMGEFGSGKAEKANRDIVAAGD